MPKYMLVLIVLLIAGKLQAQEAVYYDSPWNISDSTDKYIFTDTALIRSNPGTNNPPADTLFCGHNVIVLNTADQSLKLKGITAPWVKIAYTKNNIQQQGYVWAGLLSLQPLRRGNTKFIFGIDKYTANKTAKADDYVQGKYTIILKLLRNDTIVNRYTFLRDKDESFSFVDTKLTTGLGLKNVSYIARLNCSGEACGIPSYSLYFAIVNDKILKLPTLMSVGDADIYFHDETFTFPAEKNGKPNTIIWDMKEEAATEKLNKKGEPVYKKTSKRKLYSWNGKAVTNM